jgi:hypothetical protein
VTTICAAALVAVLIGAAVDEPGPPASEPTLVTASPVLGATPASGPPTTRPTPTTTTLALMRGSPRVNRIEEFSAYPDGVQVQIEEAEWWVAPGSVRMHLVKALVRIRNRSGRSFDPGDATVAARYGPKRATARLVESGRFTGAVRPGAQRFAQWLFAVPAGDSDNLEIEVSASRDRQSLLFRGPADQP